MAHFSWRQHFHTGRPGASPPEADAANDSDTSSTVVSEPPGVYAVFCSVYLHIATALLPVIANNILHESV
jgi:hypothetical protein